MCPLSIGVGVNIHGDGDEILCSLLGYENKTHPLLGISIVMKTWMFNIFYSFYYVFINVFMVSYII